MPAFGTPQFATRYRLEPLGKMDAAAPDYLAHDDDPHFVVRPLDGAIPSGRVLLRCRLDLPFPDMIPVEPTLYPDTGNDFDEAGAIGLGEHHGGILQRILVLPPGVRALRFDPMNGRGAFTLEDLTIEPLTRAKRLRRVPGQVRRGASKLLTPAEGESRAERLAKVGGIVAREGVRGLIREARQDRILSSAYADWVARYDTLRGGDRRAILRRLRALPYQPVISVVTPVYDTPEPWLRRCIQSVRDQLYPHWQLCLADDASPSPHVAEILEEYAASDPDRIKWVRRDENGHIAAASNSALELATGNFVQLLDHDDELAPHALYMVAEALNEAPDLDILYFDEDKIDESGRRYDPWFKPDWNPTLMTANNQVVHPCYRRSLLLAIDGFRLGTEGSQDYDLALRAAERTTPARIRHLPHVLYHWRAIKGSVALAAEEKPYAHEIARQAIARHLEHRGRKVETMPAYTFAAHRIRLSLPDPAPKVSVIIPTRDKLPLLRMAVEGVLEKTDYPSIELIVVDNGSEASETLSYLEAIGEDDRVRVLRDDAPYSFSRLNNRAAALATGELLLLLNNDIEVIEPGWLTEMASHAVQGEVGAVGCLLRYPDRTVQHAGIVVGMEGRAGPVFNGWPDGSPGPYGRILNLQEWSAVTAACLLTRTEVYRSVSGLDEANLPIAFNDVDYCLRLRECGFRIIYTPHAELIHHESASLGAPKSAERRAQFERESAFFKERWAYVIEHDPAYNPNLANRGGAFELAFPPRVEKPWRSFLDGAW